MFGRRRRLRRETATRPESNGYQFDLDPEIRPWVESRKQPGIIRQWKIIFELWRKRQDMTAKLTSRKFWVAMLVNIGVLVLTYFGLSEEIAAEVIIWITGLWLGTEAAAEVTITVRGIRPPAIPVEERLQSRKFWLALAMDVAILSATGMGLGEETARDLLVWINGAYLGAQGAQDTARALTTTGIRRRDMAEIDPPLGHYGD